MRHLGWLMTILCARAALAAGGVTVESIETEGGGLVQIERQGKRFIAQEGDELAEQERIVTNAGAAARLLYPDGSHLLVSENSELEIRRPEAGARSAELKRGSVRASIEKGAAAPGAPHKFFLRTGTAVMGVRGTEFVVDHDPGSGGTELHTLAGLVEASTRSEDLAAGRGVAVAAEHRVRVDRGRVGPVERFLRERFLRERAGREPLAQRLGLRAPRTIDQIRQLREQRGGPGAGERGLLPGRPGDRPGTERKLLREDRKLLREDRKLLREDRKLLRDPPPGGAGEGKEGPPPGPRGAGEPRGPAPPRPQRSDREPGRG